MLGISHYIGYAIGGTFMKKLVSIIIILTFALAGSIPALALEGATNVALHKSTSQSTTDWGGVSERAVDGNTNGNFGNNSVTHTASGYSDPWWEVDLGAVEHIHTIRIWNRTECCDDRLSNFYVFVSDSPFVSTDPSVTAQSQVESFFFNGIVPGSADITVNAPGQFVRIQIPGYDKTLSLAEVEVFVLGGEVPPIGTTTYSTTEWTNQNVVATLATTKNVTITNNGGSPVYTFDDNGSFTFTFIDEADNEGSAEAIVANIDKSAPVTIDDAPEVAAGEATVSLTASDSGSGVQMTLYELDNGQTQSGTSVYITGNGVHTLKYWSVDYAGNEELPQEISVYIASGGSTGEFSLSGLSISEGTLHFDAELPLYTTLVSGGASSVTITPVAASSQASIRINEELVESGSGLSVSLESGGNKITVEVLSDNNELIHAYTIMVMRPSGSQWNIADVVRAVDVEFDMNDNGAFDVHDVVQLLHLVPSRYSHFLAG